METRAELSDKAKVDKPRFLQMEVFDRELDRLELILNSLTDELQPLLREVEQDMEVEKIEEVPITQLQERLQRFMRLNWRFEELRGRITL
jgi:hypothetical protein